MPISENDWLETNLAQRLEDPLLDFKVIFNPKPFKKIGFKQASMEASLKIANEYDNLFIALSGGLDSEYIAMLLYELKISFKPIIVLIGKANDLESQYALHLCKMLNIEPIIINITEPQFFEVYKYFIFDKLNGDGINATPLVIAGKYVEKHKGTLITGENLIDDTKYAMVASFNDWDFYHHYILDIPCVGLLDYTPEIIYATVTEFDGSEVQRFKSVLYDLNFRPKMKPNFSTITIDKYKRLISSIERPGRIHMLGDRDGFIKMINSWNI